MENLYRHLMCRQSAKKRYNKNGYHIFRQLIDKDNIAKIHNVIKRDIFNSHSPFLRHPSCKIEENNYIESDGKKIIKNALLDPHKYEATKSLSVEIIDLICSDSIFNALHEIDGENCYTIHQTILFFIGPQTDLHIDGWALDTYPHGYAHTLWIPLQEVNLRNGPICLSAWPRGKFLDAKNLGIPEFYGMADEENKLYHAYQNAIADRARMGSGAYIVPHFDIGDFIIWSSLTPHGTLPARSYDLSRMTMQVLLRPSRLPWGTFRALASNPSPEIIINDRWRMIS